MLVRFNVSVYVDIPDEDVKKIVLENVYIHGIDTRNVRHGTKKIPGTVYDSTMESVDILTENRIE